MNEPYRKFPETPIPELSDQWLMDELFEFDVILSDGDDAVYWDGAIAGHAGAQGERLQLLGALLIELGKRWPDWKGT